MTGAMILVTVECQQAGMWKNELERSVDPWINACCLGLLTEKVVREGWSGRQKNSGSYLDWN